MVSSTSIMFMGISGSICFLLPIIIFIYFKKKEAINFKPVIFGIIVFIVFVLLLERLLHMVVIGNNLISNSILFSIYGAFAAGIFEEVGRFIAFKTVLKKQHEWKDGLAYGIGHGGIEAIFIGTVTNVQYIVFSNLINKGLFDTVLGSKVPASQVSQLNELKEMLIQTPSSMFIIGTIERVFALGMQIALTMVVLYAVKYRRNIYLFVAIFLHALMDFPAALYQMKITNIFVTESIIGIYFIIAIIFLSKTKQIFSKEVV